MIFTWICSIAASICNLSVKICIKLLQSETREVVLNENNVKNLK